MSPRLQGLLIGCVAALTTLLLWGGGALTALENLTWSWRVNALTTPPPTGIVLIALDQQSLDWGAEENGLSWPWPREAYGLILDFCRRAGAKAIAFDLLFTEPSTFGNEDDRAFAAALERFPAVGSIALRQRGGMPPQPADLPSPPLTVRGELALLPDYAGALPPLPELGAAFARLGNVSAQPDSDGVYRRVSLLDRTGSAAIPSLPLALQLATEPQSAIDLTPDLLRIGTLAAPRGDDGRTILRYYGPAATFPTYSAAALIQSELRLQEEGRAPLDPALFRDRLVIFGLTAPGLYDLRTTPTGGVFPGMEIHATALANLLTGAFLRDPPVGVTVALTLILALFSGCVVRLINRAWQAIALAVVVLPLPLAVAFPAYAHGWWLPVAPPLVAVGLALTVGLLINYAVEGKQRRFIKRAFNQYLHPTVIEQLVDHPERLRLGGERRELSIFFSDLQGFTTLSETLDPEALTALLNDYLSAMTDIILDSGGTIDKYEGDAIIAFWNAPLDQPDHAQRAVRAALACQQRLAELRPAYRARVGRDLLMRIGLNTGPAVVGNMGSQRRFDYTMLGDAVNLAARLEGVNKEFGTYTLVSHATRERLGEEFILREIGCVGVVGRKEPVRIYEPLSAPPESGRAALFEQGLAAFTCGDFSAGAALYEQLAESDRTAALYAERCRELAAAPPPEWDGVWRLTNK